MSERLKARVFTELVYDIKYSLGEGESISKLANLHSIYEGSFDNMIIGNVFINRSSLNNKLISHFADMGLQEQSAGKEALLVFF